VFRTVVTGKPSKCNLFQGLALELSTILLVIGYDPLVKYSNEIIILMRIVELLGNVLIPADDLLQFVHILLHPRSFIPMVDRRPHHFKMIS